MTSGDNKKEINILPENFKHFYYPTSPSSLIEVSSDDNTTSTYESDSDNEHDDDDNEQDNNFNNSEIKNVHMSLDLDDLEDIHVLLLDEISNVEQSSEKEKHEALVENQTASVVVVDNPSPSVVVVDNPSPSVVVVENPSPSVVVVDNPSPSVVVEENVNEMSEPKELNFKPKKRESRKNMGDSGDYKKMNLTDLRKYVIENNINIDASKMKKPEILRAIEELKELKECKEIVKNDYENEFKENGFNENEIKENEIKENEFKENEFKDEQISNSSFLVDVVEEIV
jgi:hypothetical protein